MVTMKGFGCRGVALSLSSSVPLSSSSASASARTNIKKEGKPKPKVVVVRHGALHRPSTRVLLSTSTSSVGARSESRSGSRSGSRSRSRTGVLSPSHVCFAVPSWLNEYNNNTKTTTTTTTKKKKKAAATRTYKKRGGKGKPNQRKSGAGKYTKKNRSKKDHVSSLSGSVRKTLKDGKTKVVGAIDTVVARASGGGRGAGAGRGNGFTLSARQAGYHPSGSSGPVSLKLGTNTMQALVVCTLAAVVLASSMLRGGKRSGRGMRGRGRARGTWVKDRSLGGKMIFVPATTLEDTYSSSSSSYQTTASEYATSSVTGTSAQAKAKAAEKEKPKWWKYDEFTGRGDESMRPQVQQLMTILEDVKAVYGRDVNVYDLVELKQLCERYNLSVKAKTENSRDSMFRTAMEGCLDAIENGNTMVGSDSIEEFLTGLAIALKVPQDRAATISSGEVAARIRANLLQTVVYSRTNQDLEFSLTLIKIDNILTKLPFQEDAPEVEVITRSLNNRMSDEERRKIYASFPQQREQNLNLLKEMLNLPK